MATAEQIATQPEIAIEAACVPAIAVNGLHKSFGAQGVLNGISLTVRRGETLAVLGRSGTGKSVLLDWSSAWRSPIRGRFRFTVKISPE